MFPVSDFNFVVAGLATFAATVGYTASRRLSARLSTPPTQAFQPHTQPQGFAIDDEDAQKEPTDTMPQQPPSTTSVSAPVPIPAAVMADATLTRRVSLKRKSPHDGFDEHETKPDQDLGYPHNLAHIYPNKRSRTPSNSSDDGNTPAEPMVSAPVPEQSQPAPTDDSLDTPAAIAELDETQPAEMLETQIEPPIVPEPPRTPSPTPDASARAPTTPKTLAPAFSTPSSNFVTPRPVFAVSTGPRPITFASPSGFGSFASRSSIGGSPFASFAGQAPSPFAAAGVRSASPFGTRSSTVNSLSASLSSRNIWASQTQGSQDDIEQSSNIRSASPDINALEESKPQSQVAEQAVVTGEEEEDVDLELKNVRLFVKRGNKPFAEGIVGHIKLLSHRTTLSERLLFRREPLWKVSMNLRVGPLVRCTYAPDEYVLKLVLKESIESSGENGKPADEVVVYALKPGRNCSKTDFADFAEELCKSHFKPKSEVAASSA